MQAIDCGRLFSKHSSDCMVSRALTFAHISRSTDLYSHSEDLKVIEGSVQRLDPGFLGIVAT
eukprot:scaffold96662_cov16-Tisochrysis_lutea.AAC.1